MINALNTKYSDTKKIFPNLSAVKGNTKSQTLRRQDNFIYGSSQKAKPIQNYSKGY